MEFNTFFRKAMGGEKSPYPYQERLALEPWPELLDVPTGMGKTAAVTLAWLWKYLCDDAATPRRLVWCLPMRVLVEQTKDNVDAWLQNLAPLFFERRLTLPKAYVLMGGEDDLKSWADYPEENAILVGTQDMLLSRALMRGYGMSRYQWPVHFALLHNDALWVFDEVQLMGAGLATAAQLEAFRRNLSSARACHSLWVSATLNRDWLATVDMKPHFGALRALSIDPDSEAQLTEVRQRREAIKRIRKADAALDQHTGKQKALPYLKTLAKEILAKHKSHTQTLVVLNTVERAQTLYEEIGKADADVDKMLVHARFRPRERHKLNKRLVERPGAQKRGRIVIATQAIEAGVDISSGTLFTELAPWSSLVQRFGRCNRHGEWNDKGGADVFWINVAAGQSAPYDDADLSAAHEKLHSLTSASSADLPTTDEAAPLVPVLRRRDFIDLFNTDPDLLGFDTDVSPYIRDSDDLDVHVFWREDPGPDQLQPARDEICRASLSQFKAYMEKRKGERAAWRWDTLAGQWVRLDRVRPGLVVMLDARLGGYEADLGFVPELYKVPVAVLTPKASEPDADAFDGDHRSRQANPIELARHLSDVEWEARALASTLDLSVDDVETLARTARWHDVGKAHEIFQKTMTACGEMAGRVDRQWAKSPCRSRHGRPHFRHELASMLAWIIHCQSEANADLIAYLIAAHHGKVRMSLRAMPEEKSPADPQARYARGVWEGDFLPAIQLQAQSIPETRIRLDIMELGQGDMGPSWTERVHCLLETHGPFRLAWLEALVRIADWRASKKEQEEHV